MSKHDSHPVELPSELDEDKLAEAALALLSLTQDQYGSVWKGLDWSLMNLLFKKGWIDDPKSKSKSLQLSPEGRSLAAAVLKKSFGK